MLADSLRVFRFLTFQYVLGTEGKPSCPLHPLRAIFQTMDYNEAKAELYHWLMSPDSDNFHNLLFHMISKADPGNKTRLRLGFPNEVQVFDDWQASENQRNFFKL
jgi:hypothetical protein